MKTLRLVHGKLTPYSVIARELGVTKQRVMQIEKQALAKLRFKLKAAATEL